MKIPLNSSIVDNFHEPLTLDKQTGQTSGKLDKQVARGLSPPPRQFLTRYIIGFGIQTIVVLSELRLQRISSIRWVLGNTCFPQRFQLLVQFHSHPFLSSGPRVLCMLFYCHWTSQLLLLRLSWNAFWCSSADCNVSVPSTSYNQHLLNHICEVNNRVSQKKKRFEMSGSYALKSFVLESYYTR